MSDYTEKNSNLIPQIDIPCFAWNSQAEQGFLFFKAKSLAVVIVSYMTIRMIRNDSIQESMQIYLEQITRETDSAYYDMISIVNQMSPSGLIGNVVESYLSAEDNFDKYTGQKSLREELVKLV